MGEVVCWGVEDWGLGRRWEGEESRCLVGWPPRVISGSWSGAGRGELRGSCEESARSGEATVQIPGFFLRLVR